MKMRHDQNNLFETTKDLKAFFVEWEMRCGKTLPTLHTAQHLYEQGEINGVVIISPAGGVHLGWSRVYIPEFYETLREEFDQEVEALPELGAAVGPAPKMQVLEWSSSKAGNVAFQKKMDWALTTPGLVWLSINVEAIISPRASVFLDKFVKARRCLLICDESHRMKNPSAHCTKVAIRVSDQCGYRRNLTGTKVSQGPFDLWSQYRILDKYIFSEEVGPMKVPMKFTTFKQRFGVFRRVKYGKGPLHDELEGYKDMDHLYETIKPYTSRLTYKECYPDAVEPIIEKRLFELSEEQRRVYNELRDELVVQLDSGVEISAQQAMVNLLRLHQISRGFVGDGETVHPIGGPNPAIDALLEEIDKLEGKFIIWCKFRNDVELVIQALNRAGIKVARYDGEIKTSDRPAQEAIFKDDPECRVIVSTPDCGSVGNDWTAAATEIFYSHDYKLLNRQQALYRFQGPNQKAKTLLALDLIAADTVDLRCMSILDKKKDLAAMLTGDRFRLRQLLTGGDA